MTPKDSRVMTVLETSKENASPSAESSDHVIGEFIADGSGRTFIAFGALHGNEASGAKALERVAAAIDSQSTPIKGRIYFFRGNIRALQESVRFIDSDLNRHWTPENVIRNLPDTSIPPQLSEDREQAELLELLLPVIRSAKEEIYAIDLHSTSAGGDAFATVGDTLRNRAFAQSLPVTILLGIEEQLEGTLLEYLNNLGIVTFGFEGGQHFADETIDTHEAMIWLAMHSAGVVELAADDVENFTNIVKKATGNRRYLEVRYRHQITENDQFVMRPGFNNFDPIRKRDHIADDRNGPVKAKESGLILMPLYQTLGEDGFFIGRDILSFWIWLSGVLRRSGIGNLMHLLPGVRRNEKDEDILEIDTRVARFFPLQIFHLLGFRRLRWHENVLAVTRRKFDHSSPFKR
jgi:predicted deacylase